jgi:hypothetical protein
MWPSYKEWRSSNFTSHRANDRRQHHLSHLIFILRDARELRRNFFSDRLGARRRVGGVAGRITSRLFAPDAQPLCSAFAPGMPVSLPIRRATPPSTYPATFAGAVERIELPTNGLQNLPMSCFPISSCARFVRLSCIFRCFQPLLWCLILCLVQSCQTSPAAVHPPSDIQDTSRWS